MISSQIKRNAEIIQQNGNISVKQQEKIKYQQHK